MQAENRLKITNPQRITRILRRICQASLQVMVRGAGDQSVAVKGRASNVVLETATPCIRISNISEKGVSYLGHRGGRVQVEFILMSTKVVFVSNILGTEQSAILISLPTSLVSIERRKNARYACTDDLTAMLDLSIWKPSVDEMTAPPYYAPYRDLAGYIAIADISHGGICAVTRFPALNLVLRRGLIDDRARLVLPMQDPIEVGLEIRWFKRIKEHVKGGEEDTFMRFYRFGAEFVTQSDAVRLALRQFTQQLSQAGAI